MSPHVSRSRMIAGVAAGLALASRPASAQQTETLKLVSTPSDDLTPVYYAIRNGIYTRHGLDVQLVRANSGTAATAAVVSGAYDIGKGSVIASLVAHTRKLPLVIVANGVLWDPKKPINLAVVAPDSPIKTAAELDGKIACAPALNDIDELALSAWMDANGGNSKSVKWVEIPNGAAAAALQEHRIDLAGLTEPQLTLALDKKEVRVLAPSLSAIADSFVIAVFFANQNWSEKHPETVQRFTRATYEAAKYTNAHPDETAPMMAEITKIPLDVYRRMSRAPSATSTDPALLQPVIAAAAKYGNIPHAFAASGAYFTA